MPKPPPPQPLRLLADGKTERTVLTSAMEAVESDGPLRVLEAGCGQRWSLTLEGRQPHITGVDTDAEAMRIRREKHGDLDVELVADLRDVQLEVAAFDVVYCSFLLEHVAGARDVLDRFRAAVRPGGRIVIRIPDGDSVYGLLVKHSPHLLHILYKRFVEANPKAGTPGHAPYPTVYDDVVSLRGLRGYAADNGLRIVAEYGTFFLPRRLRRLRPVIRAAFALIAMIAPGRPATEHRDLGVVFEVPLTIPARGETSVEPAFDRLG